MSARDGHLGDLAGALVDSALDGDTRDGALAHIAGCADCRAEVDRQRQLKDLLRRSIDPSPPPGLTDRLRSIGTSRDDVEPAERPAGVLPSTASAPDPQPVPKPRAPIPVAGLRPGGAGRPPASPTRPRRSSRRLRRVTGGVTVIAFGVAAAITLGPAREQGPAVSPPVGAYTVEHARTTGGVPGADPAAGAVMTVSSNR